MSTGKIVGLINAIGGSPSGGGGLPTGGEPFKQLVTDADGNTVWEDRLAWTFETNTLLVDNKTLDFSINKYVLNPFELSIVVGGIYEVIFDGERYECVAYYEDRLPGNAFGNLSILSNEDEDSGEPFFVFMTTNRDNVVVVYVKETGTHTISITGPRQEVKKINNMFLPDIRGTAFYVNVTLTDTDTYTADKTYTEISNAITNGLIPYCVYGNYLLPMVLSNSGALSGIAPAAVPSFSVHIFSAIAPMTNNDTQYAIVSVKINEIDQVSYQYHAYSYDSTSN